ncbi:MAG: hypothetical protein CR993_08985 [Rhodobacterales bacterium]|nr:MAG: hypothetical protein CR993_08985 [Rhodobacterales bacterium]
MLKQIALIAPKIWEGDPQALADEIAQIEARLQQAISSNPYAWNLSFQDKGAKLVAEPVIRRDLDEIVKAVRDALREFSARCRADETGNQMGATMLAGMEASIKSLRRDLSKYRTSPLDLFDALQSAEAEMHHVAKYGGFEQDPSFFRLMGKMATERTDICVVAPEVLEHVKARTSVQYDLNQQAFRQHEGRWLLGLALDSEGILKQAAIQMLMVLHDPNADPEQRREAIHFVAAIMPRMVHTCNAAPDKVAEAKSKKRSWSGKLRDVFDTIIKGDKAVDAFQENIPEMLEAVAEIAEMIYSRNWPGISG